MLGKPSAELKDESKTASEFDEAFAHLCDPFLPVRGHAMIKLASLVRQRHPKAMESADTLLKIFLEQLAHDDSYIYLAAIQGLVSLADIRADTVIPRLTQEFATCRKVTTDTAGGRTDGKEKGYYMPSDKGWFMPQTANVLIISHNRQLIGIPYQCRNRLHLRNKCKMVSILLHLKHLDNCGVKSFQLLLNLLAYTKANATVS